MNTALAEYAGGLLAVRHMTASHGQVDIGLGPAGGRAGLFLSQCYSWYGPLALSPCSALVVTRHEEHFALRSLEGEIHTECYAMQLERPCPRHYVNSGESFARDLSQSFARLWPTISETKPQRDRAVQLQQQLLELALDHRYREIATILTEHPAEPLLADLQHYADEYGRACAPTTKLTLSVRDQLATRTVSRRPLTTLVLLSLPFANGSLNLHDAPELPNATWRRLEYVGGTTLQLGGEAEHYIVDTLTRFLTSNPGTNLWLMTLAEARYAIYGHQSADTTTLSIRNRVSESQLEITLTAAERDHWLTLLRQFRSR